MTDEIESNADIRLSDVSLIRGGLLYRVLKATKLIRSDRWDALRQIIFAVAVGWVPVFLITLVLNPEALMSFLRSYRLHSRMLIAVPVLLLGQSLMESRFRMVVEHLRTARLFSDAHLVRTDEFLTGLLRLRNSVLPEIVILLIGPAHTYLRFSKLVDATPWLANATEAGLRLTPAGWYSVLIVAPIFQFLLGLSLWKWLLWTIFAFRLSSLPMNLIPIHPDRHGGLGFLGLTPLGFAPIAFALTAVVGATWRHEIVRNHAHLIDFKLSAIALVVIFFALALLPMIFFVPRLAALRRRGILEYSTLGQILTAAFHEKWIVHRGGGESQILTEMGSSNVLDYSQAYDRIKQLIPLPVDVGTLIQLALSILIPALPMILAEIPVRVVLKDLLQALH